jgi:phosphohistidine phosphatase SixA
MEAPAITRHRRPFLAPLWVPAAVGLLLIGMAVVAYRSLDTTTVVLLRHAEKELGSIDDPPLAPEGEQRAQRLAQMFGKIAGVGRLDAIYVSDTRRTQQTVEPLAGELRLQPVVVRGADVDTLVHRSLHEHRGGTVLIVGDSDTIVRAVRTLSGRDVPPMANDEVTQVYMVSVPTLGKPGLLRLQY